MSGSSNVRKTVCYAITRSRKKEALLDEVRETQRVQRLLGQPRNDMVDVALGNGQLGIVTSLLAGFWVMVGNSSVFEMLQRR